MTVEGTNATASVFVYTQDGNYAEQVFREVMRRLSLTVAGACTVEPYWKFSDMYVVSATLVSGGLPTEEQRRTVAERWERTPSFVLTSDTIIDNVIHIPDVAMANVWK